MSPSAAKTHPASTDPSSRALASAVAGAPAWLSAVSLPAAAVLDFQGPAALWSGDRSRGVFNAAAAALLGLSESDCNADGDLWIRRIHAEDRDRVRSAWQCRQETVVCSYRWLPNCRGRAIQLRETARRLSSGAPGEFVVLTRFELLESDGKGNSGDGMRGLIHQIGNNLQSIRGEADLSRLLGTLPRESFETIVRGIENIQALMAQLESRDGQATGGEGRCSPAGINAAPTSGKIDKV